MKRDGAPATRCSGSPYVETYGNSHPIRSLYARSRSIGAREKHIRVTSRWFMCTRGALSSSPRPVHPGHAFVQELHIEHANHFVFEADRQFRIIGKCPDHRGFNAFRFAKRLHPLSLLTI